MNGRFGGLVIDPTGPKREKTRKKGERDEDE
jgi:hypothetical protein